MGPSLRDKARRVWTTLPTGTSAAPALASFLADWPAASSRPFGREDLCARDASRPPASHPPSQQPFPVLRWLPQFALDAGRFGADLIDLLATAGSLDWRQTYGMAEVGEEFLRNYAWAELARPATGIGAAQISCGVLVLGPNTLYPPHRHEAEEIYLPLAGTAEWRKGDGAWRRREPGTLIHHSSEETHAMRTGGQPLLAMYLWRSADLGQSARLDPRSAG